MTDQFHHCIKSRSPLRDNWNCYSNCVAVSCQEIKKEVINQQVPCLISLIICILCEQNWARRSYSTSPGSWKLGPLLEPELRPERQVTRPWPVDYMEAALWVRTHCLTLWAQHPVGEDTLSDPWHRRLLFGAWNVTLSGGAGSRAWEGDIL